MQLLELISGQTKLVLSPWLGGGITAFQWNGHDVFRPHSGENDPLALSSFPMVPFCNRIAHGRLSTASGAKTIALSHKNAERQHALHGLGWISPWAAKVHSQERAILSLRHDGAIWPWAFEAEQEICVRDDGYSHKLSVTNLADTPMPAGLGLHPYFPKAKAGLQLDVSGFWETGPDRLPTGHSAVSQQPDWFATPDIDNCYTGQRDDFQVSWPTHSLTVRPSTNLPFTHVYCPTGEDFFCVEPVSHIPNAINNIAGDSDTSMHMLQPGQSMEIDCDFILAEAG